MPRRKFFGTGTTGGGAILNDEKSSSTFEKPCLPS